MKTQIKNLVNGRIEGQVGTNESDRAVIAEKVIAENGESLNVEINGVDLVLNMHKSTSGKTIDYYTEITEEQAKKIMSITSEEKLFSYESSFQLHIDGTMRVSVDKFTRKTPGSQWKSRGWDYISESKVTIK